MLTQIAEPSSSKDGVSYSMAERVGVGMTEQPYRMGYLHPSETERAGTAEAVYVDPQPSSWDPASAHRRDSSGAESQPLSTSRSSGRVNFRLRGSPATASTRTPSASTRAASSSASTLCSLARW